ncbi:MAG: hypothetical protein S4CHLAM81_00120 [Chlamydiales bacterium]|nr:hypothetical protein [Chlamydiales bacterium]MCH9634814.1 hypothetical protein [Chlamydiales bacterium]MCH9703516.1 hypothetical protein [Chlamydiota bacterium]
MILLTSAQPDLRRFLLILHSEETKIEGNTLVMGDVSRMAVTYTVIPHPAATVMSVQDVVDNWKNLFYQDKTNASIVYKKNGSKVRSTASRITNPRIEGDTLKFDILFIGSHSQEDLGECVLFVFRTTIPPHRR